MQIHPLIHFCNDFGRNFSINYTIKNLNRTFILTVRQMNVRRIVVSPIETDDNSEEFRDFRLVYLVLCRKDTTFLKINKSIFRARKAGEESRGNTLIMADCRYSILTTIYCIFARFF